MLMPGRKYSAGTGYRYGFNGKENDNEVKGEGNQQDYGMRIYDPRIGKFLSVDPLTKEYAYLSPYTYAENDVIRSVDLDGAEKEVKIYQYTVNADKTILITPSDEHNFYDDPHGVVAKSLVSYNNLPGNGYFQIYRFQDILGIQTFAKYIYADEQGKVQIASFSHDVLQGTYDNLKDLMDEIEIGSSILNAISSGVLLKSEVKAATGELKAVSSELKAATPEIKAAATPGPSLKTAGGSTITNSKWADQFNPTAWSKGFEVPVKTSGYPDFSKYLYTGGVTPLGVASSMNTVKITMTGTYAGDFAAANKAAGLSATPKGYTWHHAETMGEMQLIQTEAHEAARHSGGVQLYKDQHNGKGYR